MTNHYKNLVKERLAQADVRIDGTRPWDVRIHHDRFYSRVIRGGSLAFGESYMDGWWDCDALDELIQRLVKIGHPVSLTHAFHYLKNRFFNTARKSKASKNAQHHYDIGNDLFEAMLDKRMIYSCAYWKNAKTLDEAQEAKLDLICRKLGLQKGQRILDIGCGWGGFAHYAATKYGVSVVGITISQEQVEYARQLNKNLPVEIRFQDYRDLNESFDHIVSIGMFEHVGPKNYVTYMKVIRRCLKDHGLFLLHTIGSNKSVHSADPWLHKYIFPHAVLPSIKQIAAAMEGLLVMEDWHNFGSYYEKTLLAWFRNFNKNWPKLKEAYDERFYRMWKFYLLACAGYFRARINQLWQIVMSKKGLPWAYESVR